MKLKTKDELLIVSAFESLRPNFIKIKKYLNFHNIFLTENQINYIYNNLKKQSHINGYTKVLQYIKDKRYLEAIIEFKNLQDIYIDVLENKIDYNNIKIPKNEPSKIDNQILENVCKPKTQIVVSGLQTPEIYNNIQIPDNVQIEPQTIKGGNNKNKIKIESPKNLKDSKRYVVKMNENEKLLDDFFDYLDVICEYHCNPKEVFNDNERSKDNVNGIERSIDDGNGFNDREGSFNRGHSSFNIDNGKEGIIDSVCGNTNLNITNINQTNINTSNTITTQNKINDLSKYKFIKDLKTTKSDIKDILNQYNSIMYKIKNKKHEKDKSLWKYEIKIIIGYIITVIGHENEFREILNNVENNSLQVNVMNVLMKIQDVMMSVNDKDKVYKCDELKKGVSNFCDYYKK